MGYQALLFCPDEKTARTVTQVLNELEFNVEACIEPFAAVKKLMGQHFDAVVVDCDNEQNATLLFKSARNSSSNQTSLAVAVVEGQAGVAKAFRIGANLVLTKPINIEQAKGTLRVARGLLRKSDPAKPGAPVASVPSAAPTAPQKSVPAPSKPISSVKPVAKPAEIPAAKPAAPPAWPVPAAASTSAAPDDSEPLEIGIEEPKAAPIANATPKTAPVLPTSIAARPPMAFASSGAASAPAPARTASEPPVTSKPQEHAAVERSVEVAPASPAPIIGSAPSFTFGGSTTEPSSEGGNKKIFIGVAAGLLLAAVGFFGYSHLSGHSSAPANTTVATTSAPATAQPTKPSAQSSPVSVNSGPAAEIPTTSPKEDEERAPHDITLHSNPASAKPSKASSATPSKSDVAAEEEEPAPLVVKGGKVSAHQGKANAAADVAAPSLAGIAPGTTPPPNFVPSTGNAFKPVLQTLNISQGVSQGLLLKKVSPTYPPNAIHMRIEGTVELLATISKDGTITRIKVISGDSQLTKSASDAVKQWKYKPYLLNGEPVEIQTQVTVNFKLPR